MTLALSTQKHVESPQTYIVVTTSDVLHARSIAAKERYQQASIS